MYSQQILNRCLLLVTPMLPKHANRNRLVVYSKNSTGASTNGLLRATARNSDGIQLPSTYPNGSYAVLGDDSDLGYPTALYPNITYTPQPGVPDPMDSSVNATFVQAYGDFPFNASSSLLLGPLQINNSFACENSCSIFIGG